MTQRTEPTPEDLREYAERMHEAERIARFGVWKWEIASGRVLWSDELHRIYGLAPGEFEGTVGAFTSCLHPDDRDRVWAHVDHAIRTNEPFAYQERIIRADGEERVLLSQGRPVAGPDGGVEALVGVCHDVTERIQAERALGLSERRMRAILDYSPSIIAVKDLDGRYLMTNAETGRLLGRPADELVGQFCVDLFAPDLADQLRCNDRLAIAEGEPVYDEAIVVRDGEPRMYVTVTFVLPDDEGHPVETCTIATDVTERRERESGRRERLEWEQRIGSALAEDRMLVYSQPIIDLVSGEEEACELLVRLRDDDSATVLSPAEFLPAAERFGLVQAIDVRMVGQALSLTDTMRPTVNLSAVTLCDAAVRDEITALLAADPRAAERIVFEITETAALEHLETASALAEELTALGSSLALDDFGTGFGSFTYLRTLPMHYLKIDGSFVGGLVRSHEDRRVVQCIIGIARQFGLRTIAEGVEDQETLDLLRELGADCGQGFHIGHPAPLAVPAVRAAALSEAPARSASASAG